MSKILCPLCKHSRYKLHSKYFGSFFEVDDLNECDNCKLIFASKMPDNIELDQYYKSGLYYDSTPNYNDKKIINFLEHQSKARLELIKSQINFKEIKKTIDIGGGFARFGKILKRDNNDIIYDIVEPALNLKNTWGEWVNKHFIEINDLDDQYYDLSIISHVLEHVTNPIEFLNSIIKKMKPKSYLFLEVPYKDYLYKRSVTPHVTFWNLESFEYISKELNLNLVYIDSCGLTHKNAIFLDRNNQFFEKLINPYIYIDKLKDITGLLNLPFLSDNFLYKLSDYGGSRIWLRILLKSGN